MTLLDVTMAVAAHGKLTGKGCLMHHTATITLTEGTVFDEEGRAHATGTFKYVKRLAVGPKDVNPLHTVISTD